MCPVKVSTIRIGTLNPSDSLKCRTGICCQVAILGNPTGQRAYWNGNTETLFDALDDPNHWFTAIVEDQTLENQFQ